MSPAGTYSTKAVNIPVILPLLQYPDPLLTNPVAEVEVDADARFVIANVMFNAMQRGDNDRGPYVGIAANQVGFAVRAIMVRHSPSKAYTLFNPVLTVTDDETMWLVEECGSLPPGYKVWVPRARGVRVTGQGVDGSTCTLDFDGLLARVAQHEVDHLNGLLINRFQNEPENSLRPLAK